MSRKTLTLLMLLILPLVLTACVKGKDTPAASDSRGSGSSDQAVGKEQADAVAGSGSILDLIKLGKSLKCTVRMKDTDATFTQTMYVSNNKVRTDAQVKVTTDESNEKIDTHMILDGDIAYMWSSNSPQGTKMNVKEFSNEFKDKVSSDADSSSKYASKFTDSVDYDCKPWLVDSSVFDVPTDIEFVDMAALLKNLPSIVGTACDMCNSLSGDLKEQCKKNADCN